jgi:hypothetical protein
MRDQSKASRAKVEAFMKQNQAELWIEHDIATHAKLPKARGVRRVAALGQRIQSLRSITNRGAEARRSLAPALTTTHRRH